MTLSETTTDTVLTVTDKARAKIVEVRQSETDPDSLALWLEITGAADGQYTYDMWFQARDEAGLEDIIETNDGLSVVIVAGSAEKLQGSTLDISKDLMSGGGMVITNPNKPELPGMENIDLAAATLDSDIARKVHEIIENQINPQIASHGGAAHLVGVNGTTAYVELSGGCQGCSMSRATLSQGISVMVQEAVPEITSVLDVTDHASGSNPYYQ